MASQDPTDRILLNMVDPLTVIRNAARTAQERLADGGSIAEIQKDLTYIRAAAAQLNRLLGEARAIKR
jgi:hypothetical protein